MTSTPTTFSIQPPTAEELARALEQESHRQQEMTPEPIFQHKDPVQSYDLLCEIERSRFAPAEIDRYRAEIRDPEYWMREAQRYRDKLSDLLWQKIIKECFTEGISSTDGWRNTASIYAQRLMDSGCSADQVREKRHEIKDQSYWKPEAELLRRIAAQREAEMIENHLKKRSTPSGIPSPAETEKVSPQLRSSTRPKPRRLRRSQRIKKIGDAGIGTRAALHSESGSRTPKRRAKTRATRRLS